MNKAEIRDRVHEAFGETSYPAELKARLEQRLRQPAETPGDSRAVGLIATLLALIVVAGLVLLRLELAARGTTLASLQHEYSVAAIVEVRADGTTDVCYPVYPLNEPQTSCYFFTVPVRLDASTLPRDKTLVDGTIWSPPLELTGTWTGKDFVVTSLPTPVKEVTPAPRPGIGSGSASATEPDSFHESQARLIADDSKLRARGIWVAESGWSPAGFYVILTAADQADIDYVKSQYSPDVVVSWFKFIS